MTVNESFKVRKMILTKQLDKNLLTTVYIEQLSYSKDLKKNTKRISTGIKIYPSHWSKSKQEVLKQDPDYDDKNKVINDIYIANLKPIVVGKADKYTIDYLDNYIKLRKAKGDPYGTVKEHTTVKGRLKQYQEYTGKKLKFIDMDYQFSDDFYLWLRNEKKYSEGTIEKTYLILRTCLNYYYQRRDELDVEMNDKFRNKIWKHGEKSVNAPHPCTNDDFFKLCNGNLENLALQRTRDRFLFQSTTGIRFGDAFTITQRNIENDCIKYSPSKTRHKRNNMVWVNLNDRSRNILKKYDYDMTQLKITNQKYNQSLVSLCEKLELQEVYKTHDGRDTFITSCINQGISIPVILSWTGQETYEIMKRYFRIDEHKKKIDMSTIAMFQIAELKDENNKELVPPEIDGIE